MGIENTVQSACRVEEEEEKKKKKKGLGHTDMFA